MTLASILPVLTLALSGLSAWSAYEARIAAESLNERKFDNEATLRLLAESWEELEKANGCDPKRAVFITTLLRAELKADTSEPLLVHQFVEDLKSQGLWSANCDVVAEAALAPATEGSPTLDAIVSRPETPEPGQWHAVIASYDVTAEGCALAKDDISEFANLLQAQVDAGIRLSVLQTRVSGHYAVTLDAGDDQNAALRLRDQVRAVSENSADGRTGRDSFVQRSREWVAPQDCAAGHTF
ncbi:hypothetical protein [Rhodobacter sp. SY28-1]|uniref:hypothetical protein n=1 Tax=Rhodobacter sp. SY28-1 TaxID=2562317 RepID=UPI0010BF6DD6|nr:hypothetical protein [Rhodobacter sp. SY28-1]